MTKNEDIRKAIEDGVGEVFANAGKYNPKMDFRNVKPLTPDFLKAHEEQMEVIMREHREKERIFKLTHKYQAGIIMYCPKCNKEFEVDDGTYQYYEDHVSDCIKDCTGCDSFESEKRCYCCYTYSLWAERIKMPQMDDLIEEGVMKATCPRCGQEVLDDFELMAEHLDNCQVNCKTCKHMKVHCLEEPCKWCSGYQKWEQRGTK